LSKLVKSKLFLDQITATNWFELEAPPLSDMDKLHGDPTDLQFLYGLGMPVLFKHYNSMPSCMFPQKQLSIDSEDSFTETKDVCGNPTLNF